jgi:hypothetical protein
LASALINGFGINKSISFGVVMRFKNYMTFLPTVFLLMISCSEERKINSMENTPVETSKVPTTISCKVFFGHQSVGNNIISGIQTGFSQVEIYNIKGKPVPSDGGAGIYHQGIGQNGDPVSKMKDFKKRLIDEGLCAKMDIAMMKLCYVDITRNTDVVSVFKEYKNTIDTIKTNCQALKIIHCTVPLESEKPINVKQVIKKILYGKSDNIARNKFNDLIRNEFTGKDLIFDLAKIESTRPDGSQESFTKAGRLFFSLYSGYTDDGGHLNKEGQKRTAFELLKTIQYDTK